LFKTFLASKTFHPYDFWVFLNNDFYLKLLKLSLMLAFYIASKVFVYLYTMSNKKMLIFKYYFKFEVNASKFLW